MLLKNFFISFVISLPIFENWKKVSYNFILVIIIQLKKMIYYKFVKTTINTPG